MPPAPRKRFRFALWFESTSNPHYFLIAVITFLYAPSLLTDFTVDDHRLLRVFREYHAGLRSTPNAYQFLAGDERNKLERDAGWYPWWLPDELKYKHFRPLSERFLYGEYLLFGEHPLGFRLVGLALYALGVLLVFQLFRLVGRDERLARWAALIFTLAASHAVPVVFISAHCDILALLLAAAAALLTLRYLETGSLAALITSLLPLVAGLFAKEAVLPLVLWPVIAWLILRDGHDAARRTRVIASCWLMLAVGWLALYRGADCGANTSLMLDPLAAPLDYLRAFPLRAVLLLSTWLIPLNPFLLEFQVGRADLLLYQALVGGLALAAVSAMFLLHHRRQRGILAMALWPLAFLPILVCTPPDDRVMVLPSVGLSFLAAAWLARPHESGSFKLRRLPLFLFILLQLITSSLTIAVMGYMEHCSQNNLRTIVAAFGRPLQPGDQIFILNCPYPFDGLFLQDRLHRVLPDSPADARLLTDATNPMVTRLDARTLRFETRDKPFLQSFLGHMGTIRNRPQKTGDRQIAGPLTCLITDADERGVKTIDIEFEQPLESDSYRFFWYPTDGAPRPWPIPPLTPPR